MWVGEHRFLPSTLYLIWFNLIQGCQIPSCALPSQVSLSLSTPFVSFYFASSALYMDIQFCSAYWAPVSPTDNMPCWPSQGTQGSGNHKAPHKSDLGDLPGYPQFYPLQILPIPPDLLLEDTPFTLLSLRHCEKEEGAQEAGWHLGLWLVLSSLKLQNVSNTRHMVFTTHLC